VAPAYATHPPNERWPRDEAIIESLVIAVDVIMLDKLRDHPPEVAFADRNDAKRSFLSELSEL